MTKRKRATQWTYQGVTIERVTHSGMYRAWGLGGYLFSDTLAGIKALIRATSL